VNPFQLKKMSHKVKSRRWSISAVPSSMAPPPETEFERGLRSFGILILKTVFMLVLFVFLTNLLKHREVFESLLFAVALAVGLTPEFLPVISAVPLTSLALPFLPMLPAQISIPTDHVDRTFTIKPRHWDISLIRKFMVFIGPLSSVFDFMTFYILLTVFQSSAELFHTG